MTEWAVDVVERGTETLVTRVPTATVVEHTRRLNEIDDAVIDVSLFDPGFLAHGLDQDVVLGYEARITRNGIPWLVGPWLALDADLDSDIARFGVVSWWWYFTKRYFGDAERISYVSNGGFETGDFTDWTEFGSVTKTIEGGILINEGDKAAILVATANETAGISQTLASITHSFPPGLGLIVSASANVDPSSILTAGETPVLRIRVDDGTTETVYDVPWRGPSGLYERLDEIVPLRANTTYTITVQLLAINGIIRWDSVRVFFQDSTTVAYPGQDQSVLLETIIDHAQDSVYGKSDLAVGVDAPATGVSVLLGYPHFLHENILDAVVALTERRDGFDIAPLYASREIAVRYPRRGSVKPRWRIGTDRNVGRGGRVRVDGSQLENWHVAMGDPEWSEEGGYVDAADLGGLTLEGVKAAPVGYPLRQLGQLAEERVRQRKRRTLDVQVDITQHTGDIAANIEPGDTIPLLIERGWLDIDLDARAVQITEIPRAGDDGADVVRVSMSPVDSSGS